MDTQEQDYLFDLNGYIVLEQAINRADLTYMNEWIDAHWDHVERRKNSELISGFDAWVGHVEVHSYSPEDGVNFQNIIEAGPIFEKLIDYPPWIDLVRKYINPVNGLSIHENFLNVRGRGGHLFVHCGGHAPLCYLAFRQHNTGEWMVGQINVLMALEDIGPGDGPTVLIPGSHKATEPHPDLVIDGKELVSFHDAVAGTALGMKEIYLKAGDVLMFTDAVTHGSAQRINPGHRRVGVYRYSSRFLRTRFNYVNSITKPVNRRTTPNYFTGGAASATGKMM